VRSLISCIVPVHNGERFLAEAIDSILAQDHDPLEVVVVDDGSTDRSAEIAESYGEPVRVVRQEHSRQTATRNRGLRESRGEYIAFLDADDLYRPRKLSTQLRHLRASPETEICLCTAENFWEPGLEDERERYLALGRSKATHTFVAMLARRSVFDRVGPLDETQRGDQIDWFVRASAAGAQTIVLPDVLVDRRMHRDSVTHSARAMDEYLDFVKARIDRQRAG
jgi:glycosyltransferase involved in cell wall biosynthesis